MSHCKNCNTPIADKIVEWIGDNICPTCYDDMWQKCFAAFKADMKDNPHADVEIAVKRRFSAFSSEFQQQYINHFLKRTK